jgi:hypothetical protein
MVHPILLPTWLALSLCAPGAPTQDNALGVVIEEATMTLPLPVPGDALGTSVTIHGDEAYAGAPGHAPQVPDVGAVYRFDRTSGSWGLSSMLVAPDGQMSDRFGEGVACDGDRLVVGAPGVDDANQDAGAVYVFVRSGTNWAQEAKLTAPDADPGDALGSAVDVDGDLLIAGAPLDDTGHVDTGSAYLFERHGSSWTFLKKLRRPTNPLPFVMAGSSVAIDGRIAAVSDAGVWFREEPGTDWDREAITRVWGRALDREHGCRNSIDPSAQRDRLAHGEPAPTGL